MVRPEEKLLGHFLTLRTPTGRKKCEKCGWNVVRASANGKDIYTIWRWGNKLIGVDKHCPGPNVER